MFGLLALIGFGAIVYGIILFVLFVKDKATGYNAEHERIIAKFRESLDKTLEEILNEKW